MSWWISDPDRALHEKSLIAGLQTESDWLEEVIWGFEDNLLLCASLTLRIEEQSVPLVLRYPSHFPDVPPSIKPARAVFLSSHQWGSGGELCTEYRADNWRPEYTGADLIASAYRLLSGEISEETPPVPSAHNQSLGQEIRNRPYRFLTGSPVVKALDGASVGSVFDAEIYEVEFGKTHVSQVTNLRSDDEVIAKEPRYLVTTGYRYSATAIRVPDDQSISRINSASDLNDLLSKIDGVNLDEEALYGSLTHILLSNGKDARLLIGFRPKDKNENAVFIYTNVPTSPTVDRNPDEYDALAEKSVAIVGCGSVGSKVAISLARAGIGTFTLVDHDIFEPGNITRNALDRRAIGVGKAKALKHVVSDIDPTISVTVRQVAFGGQESSETTASVLEALSKADIIIDATADSASFNLCAAASRKSKTALVWGEVYGGGIGGLVARCRPELDPPPHDARNQLTQSIAELGVPWPVEGNAEKRYAVDVDADRPLVADDADVSVIAAHLARFAIDWLIKPAASDFPNSAYLVGLKAGWVFKQPFETWPIAFTPSGAWGVQKLVGERSERLVEFINDILPDNGDENGD